MASGFAHICNPEEAALVRLQKIHNKRQELIAKAAGFEAAADWLYFVAQKSGSMEDIYFLNGRRSAIEDLRSQAAKIREKAEDL